MQTLDINKISKGKSKNIKIGELTSEVIDILHLDLKPQNINIWSTRLEEHCGKHKTEYSSPTAYNRAVNSIPEIILNPDYVGLHKNGNIQYIKKLDDISLVGIQIVKGGGGLLFRTIFPISEIKLQNSIKSRKFIPFTKKKEILTYPLFFVWLFGGTAYPNISFKTISGVIAATFYPQITYYNSMHTFLKKFQINVLHILVQKNNKVNTFLFFVPQF